jgi:hypothetical protein
VQWSNFTESNVDHYDVERSFDEKSLVPVVTIEPLKNNGSKADYLYNDVVTNHQIVYYRIKAIEKDKQISYSRIMVLNTQTNSVQLMVLPNPVKGNQINFKADHLPQGIYQLHLFNASGNLLHTETLKLTGSSINQSLNIVHLQSGYYTLELTGAIQLKQAFVVL